MPARRSSLLFSVSAVLLAGAALWLSCGVYTDREFDERHFFVKPRWSTRFYFYAPLGESDRDMRSLGEADRRAERDYQEFVEGRRVAEVRMGK